MFSIREVQFTTTTMLGLINKRKIYISGTSSLRFEQGIQQDFSLSKFEFK